MIKTFANKLTEKVFNRERTKLNQNVQRKALRKLVQLHTAIDLEDLATPPGNRLEALSGDRDGQYSIRVNRKWRICFSWEADGVYEVEIVDYH